MNRVTFLFGEGFRVAGIVLLVAVGFALFAIVAVAMRPLLIGLAIAAVLVAVVLSHYSPKFREWFEALGEQQVSYSGLRLATDVAVHPSHSWARLSRRDAVVGADDLIQSTLGPVEAVELPAPGIYVNQGQRVGTLRRGNRYVTLRTPVSGTIVAANEALMAHPGLVNDDPFERGWVVKIRTENVENDRRRLVAGKDARSWFRREIDRLLMTILGPGAAAPALPDGGTLVADLHGEIDDQAWNRLTAEFFREGGESLP